MRASCRQLAGIVLMLWLGLTGFARADERIHSFDVVITMEAIDRITVTEKIAVTADNLQIKRGIYRDIPLQFKDKSGALQRAGFDIVSVKRNEASEPYHVVVSASGVRIYIGDADVYVDRGQHVYEITYTSTRQIRSFADYDELAWNVTGNEWVFPIDKASARIIPPPGVNFLQSAAYTGAFGQSGADFVSARDGDALVFQTTRTLAPREGMTVSVAVPKGVIGEAEGLQKLGLLINDYHDEAYAGAGLLAVFSYYFLVWVLVGRDPKPGVIIPLFSAPKEVSPGLAHYVYNRGFSDGGWTALSAAMVDLAVKGLVRLDDLTSRLRINVTGKAPTAALPKDQAVVLDQLSQKSASGITLSQSEGPRVVALGNAFRAALEKGNKGVYFKRNIFPILLGIGLTIAIGYYVFNKSYTGSATALLVLPLGIIALVFAGIAIQIVKGIMTAKAGGRVGLYGALIATVVVGAAMMGGFVMVFLQDLTSYAPAAFVVGLAIVNIVFMRIVEAPTALGRQFLDSIEGLRLYLSVAEAERMNMAGAPAMSPTHYETLLPYAIALGVEKPWSSAFQAWLSSAAAGAEATNYNPSWYSGRDYDRNNFSSSVGRSVAAMSTAFASSVPVPESSSSSSGGGGSSGSGGGGGGGGGW